MLRLQEIGAGTLCKEAFGYSKRRSSVHRSLYNSLARCCSSALPSAVGVSFQASPLPPNVVKSHGRMSVNPPSWTPNFAAVEGGSGATVDPKCCSTPYIRRLSEDLDSIPTPHCLMELDEFHTFYREALHKEGYQSVYVHRGNQKRDGCGIFFRKARFSLLLSEVIDYNDLVPKLSPEEEARLGDGSDMVSQKQGDMSDVRVRLKRDCVGIIAAFRPVEAPTNVLIVANTHIFWDPVLMDVKLAQVKYLAECLLAFQAKAVQEFEVQPLLLVAGDFNSLPGDPVYKYVTSGVDRTSQVRVLEEKVDEALIDGSLSSDEHSSTSRLGQSDVKRGPGFTGRFPLPLVSVYAYLDKEPTATNHTCNFVGTLDYIFFIPSKHLKPTSLLTVPARDAPDVVAGLPNNLHPSDHVPIGSDFGIF